MMIVKIGGGATINITGIAQDLARLPQRAIVVHGANAARDELATRLGRPPQVVTSASGVASVLSDAATIDLMLMSYAGLANKRIVEALQRGGVNALGLCGLDGRLIQGRRNRGIRVEENGRTRVLHDLSGKPQSANVPLLRVLLGLGLTPVLTVPIADENGEAINAENDDVVAVLARDLQADCVVQLIEAPGMLRDPADPGSLIAALGADELGGRRLRPLQAQAAGAAPAVRGRRAAGCRRRRATAPPAPRRADRARHRGARRPASRPRRRGDMRWLTQRASSGSSWPTSTRTGDSRSSAARAAT
jgi:acetylglutamate/LysW-gamma-L-alpha-aminoadipate kinase